MEKQETFTSRQVSEITKKSIVVVSRWAKKNNVNREGTLNGILLYKWTKNDIQNFTNRKGK